MEKVKVRESNIELLRTISMFMILVIHANFVALPRIDNNELVSNTIPSITRFFIESLGIVAVNVFVFISGWFGINASRKRIFSFIYMVLFFLLGGGILFILLGKNSFSLSWLLDVFQLSEKDWFIKAYFVLMIIAPVLNTYCKSAEEKTQRYVVIGFFLFEAIYGWVTGGRRFFVDGYGPLHFIGLYITAQYVHYQKINSVPSSFAKKLFQLPQWVDLLVYISTSILTTVLMVFGVYFTKTSNSVFNLVYAYSNPLIIIGAVYLFLFFSKMKIRYSKIINWFGASSFAVYLFHGEATVRSLYFSPQIKYVFENFTGKTCLGIIFIYLCIIYLISVLVDQIRIASWKGIWKLAEKRHT